MGEAEMVVEYLGLEMTLTVGPEDSCSLEVRSRGLLTDVSPMEDE